MNIAPELSEYRPTGAAFAVSDTAYGPRLYIRDASGTRVAFIPLDEATVEHVVDCLSFPPHTLTEGDLDALPLGSFVIDKEGDVWVKHLSGQWVTEDGGSVRTTVLATFAPRPKAANLRAIKHEIETPSRGHGGCCGDQAEGRP